MRSESWDKKQVTADVVDLEADLQPDNGQEAARPGPKSKTRLRLGLAGGLIVAAAVAVTAWLYFQNRVSTDDAQVDGHIIPIASRIYGTVAEVLVDDNQPVKTGQVLVRLDPRDYQVKVDEARATLALAESRAAGSNVGVPLTRETTNSATSAAEAQVIWAESDYARAKADLERASSADLAYVRAGVVAAQARNDRAQADLNRMKPLVDKEEISALQYDSYLAAARVAASDLLAAQEKLRAAGQDLDTKKAVVAAAKAKVEQSRAALAEARASQQQVKIQVANVSSASAGVAQARAALEAAELQLSYTTIAAPVDGVVTHKSVEVGQILQQGQGMLTLVPLHDVWITANFKETDLAKVHPGQRADIQLDITGQTIAGRVDSIAGATGARLSLLPPENATGNFVKVVERIPVKIVFDTLPRGVLIRPGMNVNATIFTK